MCWSSSARARHLAALLASLGTCDRCHKKADAWLKEMSPGKASTLQAAAIANMQIAEFFERNKGWIFDQHSRAHCHAHGRLCPSYPGFVFGSVVEKPQDRVSDSAEQGDKREPSTPTPKRLKSEVSNGRAAPCAETRRSSRTTPTLPMPWWSKEPQRDADHERPVTFNVAGVTCVDWTSLGKRRGLAGCHGVYHTTWRTEREMVAEWGYEDLYFTECSEKYPDEESQMTPLAKSHNVVFMTCSPVDLGFPMRRPRCYCAGLSKKSMVWTGPRTAAEVQADFMNLFQRTTELSGYAYFVASAEDIHAWVRDRKRKTMLPVEYKDSTRMESYLHAKVGAKASVAAQDRVRRSAVSAWKFHRGLPHRHRANSKLGQLSGPSSPVTQHPQ